jgi:hypothetical protein
MFKTIILVHVDLFKISSYRRARRGGFFAPFAVNFSGMATSYLMQESFQRNGRKESAKTATIGLEIIESANSLNGILSPPQ